MRGEGEIKREEWMFTSEFFTEKFYLCTARAPRRFLFVKCEESPPLHECSGLGERILSLSPFFPSILSHFFLLLPSLFLFPSALFHSSFFR